MHYVASMRSAKQIAEGLGAVVRARRGAEGLSRKVFAERSGLSERFLAQVEAGQANPSLASLCQLAGACRLAADELLALASERPADEQAIALLGLRGAGKSAVGHRLARELQLDFVELDQEVEREAGLSVAELFELHGEASFRRRERETLRRLLHERGRLVLATGGGIVCEAETFELLRRHCRTVWLRATPEEHWRRVVAQGDLRPMEGNRRAFDELCAILLEREPLYERAELTVETSGQSVSQVAGSLLELLDVRAGRMPQGSSRRG
ncbi:MAG: transcriptional regulator [Planctomycetota bacterium]|nr:MAG: transcriptional regulator [Planctomycetota bacterium]